MKKPNQQGESQKPAAAGKEPLAREDLRAISEQIAREFPLAGDESGVVLVDVDPYRLHVYWSLNVESLERSRTEFGVSGGRTHLVLRFRELPDEASEQHQKTPLAVFDREIGDAQGSTEIRIWGAGKSYEAELGFTAEDGGWMSLACSNRVRMPPAGPSPQPALVSLDVSLAGPAGDPGAAGKITAGRSVSGSADRSSETEAADDKTTGTRNPPTAQDPSLRGGEPDPLDPEFPNPFPLDQVPGAEPATAERVQPHIPQAANRYIPTTPLLPPASSAQSLSSYALAGKQLEIHAELHISGHARPDGEFLLFGRKVPVEADGAFQVRQVLQSDALLLSLLLQEFGDRSESE